LTIQSAIFAVDIDGLQTGWQLICTSNKLMLLKVLTMSFSIFKLHFNEQRYHLEPYWAYSIAILLLMTGNASIIVHIAENWNPLIILQVILDFLRFTTNTTPSVRPSQTYNPCVYVDVPLPFSLMTNIATQLLGRNLLRNLFDILHSWDTELFEQYSINYLNVIYMYIFWFEMIFIT
jgi:hypothetical protein